MTFLYITLYVLAIALATLGLLLPGAAFAVVAHTVAYRQRLMRAVTPIKPVTLKG